MNTKIHTLSCGIVLRDNRILSCGIQIENQQTTYMSLQYSSNRGFCINMYGIIIDKSDMKKFETELSILKQALEEANKIL